MAVEFINGYKNPQFVIKDPDSKENSEIIDLDLTTKAGLIETHQRIVLRKESIGHKLSQKFMGYRIRFTLSYELGSRAINTLKIKRIFDLGDSGKIIEIRPRSEANVRGFDVLNDTDELIIGILRGDKYAPGNKNIVISFITTNVYSTLQLLDYNEFLNNLQPTGEGIDNII